MTADDLKAEIDIDIEAIETALEKLASLYVDVGDRRATVREKTAAATFLAQFYGGIENIIKRISLFHNVPLPTGKTWQMDLFKRFCIPSYCSLPELFDEFLASSLSPYRRFRYVFHHSYSFELEWERMKEGIERAPHLFVHFKEKVLKYSQGL
jgi:hypothetical protein